MGIAHPTIKALSNQNFEDGLKMLNVKRLPFISLLCLSIFPQSAFASGFKIETQGSKATGMGTAFVAVADDPSAIAYNPAGLAQLEGTNIYLGTTAIIPTIKYEGPAGASDETTYQVFYPPHLYIASKPAERLSIGLGIFSPFGLETKWSKTGPVRYAATESAIETVNINPTVAYRISPTLSIGAGIDYMKSKVVMENMVNQSLVGGSDGELSCKANGDGWGYNAGLLYKPSKSLNLGIAYRSRIKVDYNGTTTFSNIAPALQPLFSGSTYKTDSSTDLTFPDILNFGISYRPSEKLTIALEAERTGWSSYEKVDVDLKKEVPTAGFTDSTTKKDWRDTWAYKVGIEYLLNETIALRGGYMYDHTPEPESTFDPRVPDSDQQDVSIGFGYKLDKITIDAAYLAAFYKDRDVNNSILSGTYKGFAHFVGLSVGYRF